MYVGPSALCMPGLKWFPGSIPKPGGFRTRINTKMFDDCSMMAFLGTFRITISRPATTNIEITLISKSGVNLTIWGYFVSKAPTDFELLQPIMSSSNQSQCVSSLNLLLPPLDSKALKMKHINNESKSHNNMYDGRKKNNALFTLF